MKKTIFLICLISCFAWPANAQIDFAPIGAEWHYNYKYRDVRDAGLYVYGHSYNHIISEKDTVIDGNNCRITTKYRSSSTIATEQYIIKQDQGKVYYYHQNLFNLLFDLNAKVNDTVEFTFMYKYCTTDFPFEEKDTIFSARYRVEHIEVNKFNLKEFTTRVLDEDIVDFHERSILVPPKEYQTYYYSEKIGVHREFMPIFDNYPQRSEDIYVSAGNPILSDSSWLRCYSDAEISYILDWWSDYDFPCDYITPGTGIKTIQNKHLKIYPNPVIDNLFISTEGMEDIEIIDILGNIIYCSKLSKGLNKIATTNFPKGILLVRIKERDYSGQTFKIVKL